MLSRKIRSVLDKYTTFKFKHCEFNPQQGRLYFLFKIIIYFYFFLIFLTFVLERYFMFNNIYSRISFLKYLNTFNMIVLETVSYIFLGVAMMRLEPAMKIEIIISFSRCLIRANVHIFHEKRDWKLNPY